MQNSIYKLRKTWALKGGARNFTGNPPFGIEPHFYYGWSEIPVPRLAVADVRNWDAVAVKLPPHACNQTQGSTRNDSMACLGEMAQQRLETNLGRWVASGLLIPGIAAAKSKPGSAMAILREVSVGADAWAREFYCEAWTSPNKQWRIVEGGDGDCYLSAGSQSKSDDATALPQNLTQHSILRPRKLHIKLDDESAKLRSSLTVLSMLLVDVLVIDAQCDAPPAFVPYEVLAPTVWTLTDDEYLHNFC